MSLEIAQKITEWLYQTRRKLATAAVALLAAAMVWHVAFGADGMVAYLHKRAEYRNLQSQVGSLDQENQHLQDEVKRLRSDPETIERQAREQLRYARPGEVIYTLPAPKNPPVNTLKAQK